jgi:hypothetical protein
LAGLSQNNHLTILVRAAGSAYDSFEVLNGKAAGEDFCADGGTFDDISALASFKQDFQKIVENNNKTVGFQSRLGNNEENNLALYLKHKLGTNNVQIHVGADLLKEDAEAYYKTLEILGAGFKSLLRRNNEE